MALCWCWKGPLNSTTKVIMIVGHPQRVGPSALHPGNRFESRISPLMLYWVRGPKMLPRPSSKPSKKNCKNFKDQNHPIWRVSVLSMILICCNKTNNCVHEIFYISKLEIFYTVVVNWHFMLNFGYFKHSHKIERYPMER